MSKQQTRILSIVIAALLSAIGIIIPNFAPRIQMPPASFTLASHVPIFIAMFISPPVAITVSLITTLGFLFSGVPMIIVLRALTHVIFAATGAFILMKNNKILLSPKKTVVFSLFISLLHAVCEVIIVTFLFFGDSATMSGYTNKGYLVSVIGLVGLGTMVHSMIDFSISLFIWKPLQHVNKLPSNAKVRRQ